MAITRRAISEETADQARMALIGIKESQLAIKLQTILSEAYSDRNILLIWDQAGYHRFKDLQIPPNIAIEPLPPYSPELNQAERLWRWPRRHVCRNRLFKSLDEKAEALGQTIRNLSAEQIASMCSSSYLLHNN